MRKLALIFREMVYPMEASEVDVSGKPPPDRHAVLLAAWNHLGLWGRDNASGNKVIPGGLAQQIRDKSHYKARISFIFDAGPIRRS